MLQMTLNEIQEAHQSQIVLEKPEVEFLTNERGHIIINIITIKGDRIHAVFVSQKREPYSQLWVKAWVDLIKENYTYNEDLGLVIPKTSVYWDIYKRYQYGKEMVLGTGRNQTTINGQPFNLPSTGYYFNKVNQEVESIRTPNIYRGVYGIKCGDELIYIGSSSTNIMERWQQHVNAFMWKDDSPITASSPMYRDMHNHLDEISFILIYSDRDIGDMLGMSSICLPSTYIIQYTELLLIRVYKPKYNSEGITTNFRYQGTCELDGNGIPLDYIHVVRHLLDTDSEEYREEGVKQWIIGQYGEDVYNVLTSTPLRNDTYDEYLRSYKKHIW